MQRGASPARVRVHATACAEGLPEDWKYIRNDHRYGTWLEALIEVVGRLELTTLADLWLKNLVYTGLRDTDPSSGSIPGKELSSYNPNAGSPYADIRPAKLEGSREVIWLRADGRRTERGRHVTILSTPLRTDTAILAALTALHNQPRHRKTDGSAVGSFPQLSAYFWQRRYV